VALAGDDIVVDQGSDVILDGSGSTDDVGIVSWVWTLLYGGENVTLLGEVVNFTFDTPGEYVVKLNVTDVLGKSGQDLLTVTVMDIEPPVAVAPEDIDTVIGWVDFDGSACTDNVGIVYYSWRFDYWDYQVSLDGRTPTSGFGFRVSGHHRINLTVMDGAGNRDTAFFNVTVRDVEPPVFLHPEWETVEVTSESPTLEYNHTLWSDDNGHFELNGNFTWHFEGEGAEITTHGWYATVKLPGSGRYNVTFSAVDPGGNEASHSFVLVFDWRPTHIEPPTVDAGPDQEVLVMETVTLTGSHVAGDLEVVRVVWKIPTEPPSEQEGLEVSFTPQATGLFIFTFQAFDAEGNVGEDTVYVIAQPRPPEIVVDEGLDGNLSGRVTVRGRAWGDAGISRVEYYVDVEDWQNATGTTTWSVVIDTRGLEDGHHLFMARAWDGSNYSQPVLIQFDVLNEGADGDGGEKGTDLWPFIALGVVLGILAVAVVLYRFKRE
jgi:hypothetical protein